VCFRSIVFRANVRVVVVGGSPRIDHASFGNKGVLLCTPVAVQDADSFSGSGIATPVASLERTVKSVASLIKKAVVKIT
jgi:hypothetical protein